MEVGASTGAGTNIDNLGITWINIQPTFGGRGEFTMTISDKAAPATEQWVEIEFHVTAIYEE